MMQTVNQTDSKRPIKEIVPCQVFLIEDDADDRLLAERELENCEAVENIVSFKDGQELTEFMVKQGFMDRSVILYTPMVILIDIEMPRKDGLEVLHELKTDPFLEPIPMIVLTGTESKEKIERAYELGASGVFKKPLEKEILTEYFLEAWQWPAKDMWR